MITPRAPNWYNRFMEKEIPSLSALSGEAKEFVQNLTPKTAGATLVTLSGELGAGKTSFTQAIARELGVETSVTSPTFVLMKIYALNGSAFKRLVHIDAYRLQGGEDLRALGFDEVMQDAGNLVLLEWPEQVASGLPKADHAITLRVVSETTRTLSYV